MFSNIIAKTMGVDVKYSPCGRTLNFAGQCARLKINNSSGYTVIKNLAALGKISFALLSMSLTAAAVYAGRFTVLKSPNLYVQIAAVAALTAILALAHFFSYDKVLQWYDKYEQEFEIQMEELHLVGNLGGETEYQTLPTLSSQKIHDIHVTASYTNGVYIDYLDQITSVDVQDQPVTVGVDEINRPWIAVCVKEKNNPAAIPFVQTLFQRHSGRPNSWIAAGHDGSVFEKGTNFSDHAVTIFQLKYDCHDTYELVS